MFKDINGLYKLFEFVFLMTYGRLSLKYYAIIIILYIKTIWSSFHIKLSLKIFIQQHINIYDVKPSPKIFSVEQQLCLQMMAMIASDIGKDKFNMTSLTMLLFLLLRIAFIIPIISLCHITSYGVVRKRYWHLYCRKMRNSKDELQSQFVA